MLYAKYKCGNANIANSRNPGSIKLRSFGLTPPTVAVNHPRWSGCEYIGYNINMLRPRPLSRLNPVHRSPHLKQTHRPFSTPRPQQPKSFRTRLLLLNHRLPPSLRFFTTPLINAPVAHVSSFVILHEITAILPLFGLVGAFHYGNWFPDIRHFAPADVVDGAVDRFGRWLMKRGWVSDDALDETGSTEKEQEAGMEAARLVMEFAAAYVITKALLPIRILTCVWATPWFARAIFAPLSRGVRRLAGEK